MYSVELFSPKNKKYLIENSACTYLNNMEMYKDSGREQNINIFFRYI